MPSASKKVADKQIVSQFFSYNTEGAIARWEHTSIISLNGAAVQNTVGIEIDLAAAIRKDVGDDITEVGSFGDIYVAGGEGAVNCCRIDNIGEKCQDEGREN